MTTCRRQKGNAFLFLLSMTANKVPSGSSDPKAGMAACFAKTSSAYAETDAHLQITASIARKRVSLMTPQEEFSPAYFSDIAAYLTLGSGGKVILHTKTDVEIGDEENECNQDTQENNIGY